MKKNNSIKTAVAVFGLLTIISFNGCSANGYSTSTQFEVSPASLRPSEIKSQSLMQQMLDGAARDNIPVIFSVNSSDMFVPEYSEGGLFNVIIASKGEISKAIRIEPYGDFKKITIKKDEKNKPLFNKREVFSASKAVGVDNVIGETRISSSFAISGKINALARSYDEKVSNEGKKGDIEEFMRFVSSEFAASKSDIFYEFDKKNNVLYLSGSKLPLTSSPFRIYNVKKELDARKIPYSILNSNSIVIESSFEDWMEAYTINENSDPFSAQTYAVTIGNKQFAVQEGFDPTRNINIEFEGWSKSGARNYILYINGGIRKISTNERIVRFNEDAVQVSVKFF
jgi:hypothetical protein